MDLCIVGAGEMGRWVADCVDAEVAFADSDRAVAEAAARERNASAVPVETDERFDAVCLAVPMPAVAEAVADWAPNAARAMFDVSGVMDAPVEAMREHLPDRERASLHPLFAPPRAPGNVAAVVDERGPVIDAVLDDVSAAGNTVFETTPAEHDEAMETVQGKAHAAVLAFALAGDEVREEFHTPVSETLRDLARTVTEGTPHVYADIQRTFGGSDEVADAARRIADADPEAFAELYEEARTAVGAEERDGTNDSLSGNDHANADEQVEKR